MAENQFAPEKVVNPTGDVELDEAEEQIHAGPSLDTLADKQIELGMTYGDKRRQLYMAENPTSTQLRDYINSTEEFRLATALGSLRTRGHVVDIQLAQSALDWVRLATSVRTSSDSATEKAAMALFFEREREDCKLHLEQAINGATVDRDKDLWEQGMQNLDKVIMNLR